jgi:hypothetical protein
LAVPYSMFTRGMMKRLSVPFYIIVIIRAFFQSNERMSCLTLPCSLRWSCVSLTL